jgi:hypothetical protein
MLVQHKNVEMIDTIDVKVVNFQCITHLSFVFRLFLPILFIEKDIYVLD